MTWSSQGYDVNLLAPPPASSQLAMWLSGLGVWFSLWVREVPGSNPGWAQIFSAFFSEILRIFTFQINILCAVCSQRYFLRYLVYLSTLVQHGTELFELYKVYSTIFSLQMLLPNTFIVKIYCIIIASPYWRKPWIELLERRKNVIIVRKPSYNTKYLAKNTSLYELMKYKL